jgi:hypothetical protein
MLDDRKIIAKGTYDQLLNNCIQFKSFMESYLIEKENRKTVQEVELKIKEKKIEKVISVKKEEKNTQEGKLVQKEKVKSGNVSVKLLFEYLKSCNIFLTIIFMLFYILNSVSSMCASFWLSDWSNNYDTKTSAKLMRFGIYVVIGFGQCR